MVHHAATVYILDDDTSVGRSLCRLMQSAGFTPRVFTSVEAFLSAGKLAAPACVIADVQMSGGSSLLLRNQLAQRGSSLPVILLTAKDTDVMRAEAKRNGISALFRKPVDAQALIDAIEWELSRARSKDSRR